MLRNSSVIQSSNANSNNNALSSVEILSLATFNPARALPPYLNSPRSLEACRIHGINPIELVEISVDEFRKDFPTDPNAALRRFTRIDGARRRLLQAVAEEWNRLCEIGWSLHVDSSKLDGRERIINVPAEIHSTMLELQADKFRKVEEDQWRDLQRALSVEVKRAYQESKNRDILRRHREIQDSNDTVKHQRQKQRNQAYQDKIDRAKDLEEEERLRIAEFQQKEFSASMKKLALDKENARKRKAWLEMERQKKLEKETEMKRIRDDFYRSQEEKFNRAKQLQEEIDERTIARVQYDKEEKLRAVQRERERQERKIQKSKNDVAEAEAKKREDMARKERERDENVLKNLEEVTAKKREVLGADLLKEKIARAKEQADEAENEKIEKIKADLEYREMMTRQELERVRDAQQRRKNIKAIRQEAFELSAVRRQKAVEHRNEKLVEALQRKEGRANAIKEGEATLDHMRSAMKEVIAKTTYELREGLNRLNDHNVLSPEKVMKTMAAVSESVLFPGLKKQFGKIEKVSTINTRMGTTGVATGAGSSVKRPHTMGALTGTGTSFAPRAASAGDFPQPSALYTSDEGEDDPPEHGGMTRGLLPDISSPAPMRAAGTSTASQSLGGSTSKRSARYTTAEADSRMHSSLQPDLLLSQSLDSLRMGALRDPSVGEDSHWQRHNISSRTNNNNSGNINSGGFVGGLGATAEMEGAGTRGRSSSPPGDHHSHPHSHTNTHSHSSPGRHHALVVKAPTTKVILEGMEQARARAIRERQSSGRPVRSDSRPVASRNPHGAKQQGGVSSAVQGQGVSRPVSAVSNGGGGREGGQPSATAPAPAAAYLAPVAFDTAQGDMAATVGYRDSGYQNLAQYMFPGPSRGTQGSTSPGHDGAMASTMMGTTGRFDILAADMNMSNMSVDAGFTASEEGSDGNSSVMVATMAAMIAFPKDGDRAGQGRQHAASHSAGVPRQPRPTDSSQQHQQYQQQHQQQQRPQSHAGYAPNGSTTMSSTSSSMGGYGTPNPSPAVGLFRREFSADHPLAGGKGQYLQEKSMGLSPYVGATVASSSGRITDRVEWGGEGEASLSASYKRPSPTAMGTSLSGLDPQRRLERVRREQNEQLLRVLDEERRAEENRVHFLQEAMARSAMGGTGGYGGGGSGGNGSGSGSGRGSGGIQGQGVDEETRQLEVLFAEERRRASERIVGLAKDNEQNLKQAMLQIATRG